MISPDEYLERIVAGVQAVTTKDADVVWNDVINGRQFDVVVRFTLGTLAYLVVVEVKNRTRKASVSDVEGFVQKSRDQNANKAVFVTVAGYQAGAVEVAKRHGVDLFTLTFDEDDLRMSPAMSFMTITRAGAKQDRPWYTVGEPGPVARIEEVSLVYEDGSKLRMPNEPSQMRYYLEQTKTASGGVLKDLIDVDKFPGVRLGERAIVSFAFSPTCKIHPPDVYVFPSGELISIDVEIVGSMGREIKGNIGFEPGLLRSPVVYTNAITGVAIRLDTCVLPLGDKQVSPGRFYCIMHPLAYYFCDSITRNKIKWCLVESFQVGKLIQAVIEQDISYSQHYIPVRDKKVINRLQSRLDRLRAKQGR